MTKAALVIIYNHRFEQNLEVLERIYRSRFSHIFHLMPFYQGDRPNVIPVYDNSYYFQGFLAQGFRAFYRLEFTHYFFIADDMILNPRVNEENFTDELPLSPGCSFISNFSNYNANRGKGFWERVEMAYRWKFHQNGLQGARELPSPEAAAEKFHQLKLPNRSLKFEQIWRSPRDFPEWIRAVFTSPVLCARYLHAKLTNREFHLSYPLIGGYSDIFVIPAETIKAFCHYCGVFAAGNLFVEHAIPTALVLSSDKIVTCHNQKLRGKALWSDEDFKEFEPFGRSLSRLLRGFPADYLFLHPVKLSQWADDMDSVSEETLPNQAILAHTGYRNQIENLRIDGSDLCFTSAGGDPYFFLPKVPLNPERKTSVSLDITVPENTAVQLFHQTLEDEDFREERSSFLPIAAGRHTLSWSIDARLNGHFRLDPGSAKGDYRVHGMTFRQ